MRLADFFPSLFFLYYPHFFLFVVVRGWGFGIRVLGWVIWVGVFSWLGWAFCAGLLGFLLHWGSLYIHWGIILRKLKTSRYATYITPRKWRPLTPSQQRVLNHIYVGKNRLSTNKKSLRYYLPLYPICFPFFNYFKFVKVWFLSIPFFWPTNKADKKLSNDFFTVDLGEKGVSQSCVSQTCFKCRHILFFLWFYMLFIFYMSE